jgi:hypothetical protein
MKQKQMENKNMKRITNITYPAFALLALGCFALSTVAQAQLPPPAPDGGYPNQNTAEGEDALFNVNGGGFSNTAIGFRALFSITGSSLNTAIGASALSANGSGGYNTATGAQALASNVIGNYNTATGTQALYSNKRGILNTANGLQALFNNNGNNNTANGAQALFYNNGNSNTAIGARALYSNTTGANNTANGFQALFHNTTGYKNSATGSVSLFLNTTGHDNIAVGVGALPDNTTGSFNLAVGSNAGAYLTTGNDNIDIGSVGVAGESNTLRIGGVNQTAAYITGISGAIVASGATVIVGTDGHLGTVVSSARFKEAIKPMDKASEAILALKSVTFRYKKELDPEKIPQFGLIAEEVEKVNPGLVARDAEGKVYTVRYEAVNAMLLNEFLKEHKTVQQQGATIARQQKQIEALTAGLQKVSAQLELRKAAPQTVLNNH